MHNIFMANPTTPSARTALFTVTAWAGQGNLYMTRPLPRAVAGDRVRETIATDDRTTSITVRAGSVVQFTISRVNARFGALRGPDGSTHDWTTTGPGRLAGFASEADVWAEGGVFADGWGYADPSKYNAWKANRRAVSDAKRFEVRHDAKPGWEASVGADTREEADLAVEFLTRMEATGIEVIDRDAA